MSDPANNPPEEAQPTLPAASANWQRTLWAMFGIQLVMTGAMSFLSPIIPLILRLHAALGGEWQRLVY